MDEKVAPTEPGHEQPTEQFRKTWDTSDFKGRDRFGYFREGICQAFLSYTPEKPLDRDIEARIETAGLAKGTISKIVTSPHRVLRTRADFASIPGDYMSLAFQMTGGLRGGLNGKDYIQVPKQLTLLNINKQESFDMIEDESYANCSILFDRSVIQDYGDFSDAILIDTSNQSPLMACVNLINERFGSASQAELEYLFDACISLLIAGFIKDSEYIEDKCNKDPVAGRGILQAIKSFTSAQMSNPTLSTAWVADQFGISARYIQKMFAAEGMTFKSYIINSRLDRIYLDLVDPSLGHISQSEIALRWGFRDMTTFHRNFKLRFGDAPGQIRSLGRSVPQRS